MLIRSGAEVVVSVTNKKWLRSVGTMIKVVLLMVPMLVLVLILPAHCDCTAQLTAPYLGIQSERLEKAANNHHQHTATTSSPPLITDHHHHHHHQQTIGHTHTKAETKKETRHS